MKELKVPIETTRRILIFQLCTERRRRKEGLLFNKIAESARSNNVFWKNIHKFVAYSFSKRLDKIISKIDTDKLDKSKLFNKYSTIVAKKSVLISKNLDTNSYLAIATMDARANRYSYSKIYKENNEFILKITRHKVINKVVKLTRLILLIGEHIDKHREFISHCLPEVIFQDNLDILKKYSYDTIIDIFMAEGFKNFNFQNYSENLYQLLFYTLTKNL